MKKTTHLQKEKVEIRLEEEQDPEEASHTSLTKAHAREEVRPEEASHTILTGHTREEFRLVSTEICPPEEASHTSLTKAHAQ
jgi:hypothetical protein